MNQTRINVYRDASEFARLYYGTAILFLTLIFSTEQKLSQSGKGANRTEVHYSKKVKVQAVHVY